MVASGVLLDAHMVYFDARLSDRYPTVEVRVADVCLDVADTMLIAGLVRALVETAAPEWAAGVAGAGHLDRAAAAGVLAGRALRARRRAARPA